MAPDARGPGAGSALEQPAQAFALTALSVAFVAPSLLRAAPNPVGTLAFAFASAAVFWWGVAAWVPMRPRRNLAIWFALAVCAMEADISLRYGGTQCLAVGLLLLALALRVDRPVGAGALLALAVAVEPTTALALPIVVGWPPLRLVLGFAVVLAPLVLNDLTGGDAFEGPHVFLAILTLALGGVSRFFAASEADDEAPRLALLLAALPLLRTEPSSADFVLLAPAYLLHVRHPGAWTRPLLIASAWATTLVYTSLWPQQWLTLATDDHWSKAPGAFLLWASCALVVLIPLRERARGLAQVLKVERLDALVLLGYTAITLLWARSLLPAFGSALPYDAGDPVLNTWILWWNAQAVPFTREWWNAPIFFPGEGSFALSEHLAGISPLTSPIVRLTGNPVLAYNATFLLSFPLSAAAAYALCLHLTGRRDAAFLGGLGFGFAPYRAAQLGHLQVLLSFWMPLVLLGLHGFARTRRRAWLALFAIAWVAQGLCNGYFLLHVPLLVGLWLLWFTTHRRVPLRPLLAACAVAALLLLPSLAGYRDLHERLGLARDVNELQAYAADWSSWLRPPSLLAAAHVLPTPETSLELWLFPGFTLPLLVAAAVAFSPRPARASPPRPGRPGRLLVFGAGLMAGAVAGAWSVPTTVAAGGLLIAAVALRPRLASAWREGSTLAFYAGSTLILWALSLGPAPRAPFGEERMVGPYALLLWLPGFEALRAVARLAMPASLCLAVAAAIGVARWLPRTGVRRPWAVALLAAAILADGWALELPVVPLPERSPLLERLAPRPAAVLELPPDDFQQQFAAMYRAMYHGLPLLRGFSGYRPPHDAALRAGLEHRDPELLTEVAAVGMLAVRLDERSDTEGVWSSYVASFPDARAGPRGDGEKLVWIPRTLLSTRAAQHGPQLPIRAVRADPENGRTAHMTDGKRETRWSSERPQHGDEVVYVELWRLENVGGVVLSLGSFHDDFPRVLAIDTSSDGSFWSEAWRGNGPRLAYRAALQDPREIPLRFTFSSRTARYLRLRQLGRDPVHYWSVAELSVEGARSTP